MENLNTQMDDQLKNRVAELNRANDENRDGRLDAADLKAQLNRIEAQLELQDQQNRGIIANQRKAHGAERRALRDHSGGTGVLQLADERGLRQRYGRLQPRERSGRHRPDQSGHTGSGPAGRHDAGSAGNHRTAEKVDVDALNKVLTELPALMDTVNSLQTQVQSISNWFSSLGSVFGR